MFFLMQIIFIVLPSNMAAVQNLYTLHRKKKDWSLRGAQGAHNVRKFHAGHADDGKMEQRELRSEIQN